jgi:hypothetical protein
MGWLLPLREPAKRAPGRSPRRKPRVATTSLFMSSPPALLVPICRAPNLTDECAGDLGKIAVLAA